MPKQTIISTSRLPQSTTQKIRQKNKIPYKSNTYDF